MGVLQHLISIPVVTEALHIFN